MRRYAEAGGPYRLSWTEDGEPRCYVFGRGEVHIGRAPECHVYIPDVRVTFYHARIVADAGGATLFDRQSKGGTFVNERRAQTARLQHGDEIRLGIWRLRFEIDAPRDWQIGDVVLGLYEVAGLLGEGGMGRVYRVHHRDWGMDLAVKSPRPEVVERTGGVEGFVREAETWVNLGLHPHVVSCFYVRVLGGIPRIFAEYVEGGTLGDWIESGRLYEGGPEAGLSRVLDVAIQFAWGLGHAHARGLVHQDVKPANVMITPTGVAKVTDFGIAQMRDGTAAATLPAGAPGRSVLVPGSGLMTPAYCSPEQAAARPLTRRSDTWSWALSVLEMFQGERTWAYGPAAAEALDQYLLDGSTRTECPMMPMPVAEVLARCFSRAPEDRPALGDVAAELTAMHRGLTGRDYARDAPREERMAGGGLNNRALSLFDLGRAGEAEALWQNALAIEPRQPEATFNLALSLWRTGRLDPTALAQRLDALGADPRAAAWMHGVIAAEQGDHRKAVEKLRPFADRPEAHRALRTAEDRLARSNREVGTWCRPGATVLAADVASSTAQIAIADADGQVTLWHALRGTRLAVLPPAPRPVRAVFIGAGASRVVTVLEGGEHILWNVENGTAPRIERAWEEAVPVSALTLLNLSDEERAEVLAGHRGQIRSARGSRPRSYLVATGGDDGTVRLWNRHTRSSQTFTGHASPVTAVAMSGDLARLLVSGDAEGGLRVWEPPTGRCLAILPGSPAEVTFVDVTTEADAILAGYKDGSIRGWRWDGDNTFAAPWLVSRIGTG